MGIHTLFKGLKEIFTDFRIFLYTVIPMLISAGVVAAMLIYGWDLTSEWAQKIIAEYVPGFMSKGSWFNKGIYWLINGAFKILMILALTYLSFILIQLVSIPFYSLICERVLYKRGAFPDRPFRFMTWLRLTIRMFIISLIRMLVFLVIWVFVFIISFIPGLQFVGLFYSSMVIGLDSIDYTLEIYEMSFGRRMKIYLEHFGYFSAVGLILLPALFIPGLILLLLPATVVGMSVQFAETLGKEEYEKLIA